MNANQLRKIKAAMFSERKTCDDVLAYVQEALPKEYHAAGITACMMMFNTLLENLAQEVEKNED